MDKPRERVAYLDGLRGWMAMAVVAHHFLFAFRPDKPMVWLGHSAVCVFFVLSGYVLAPMARNSSLCLPAQIARRLVRLELPILGALVFAWALWATGLSYSQQFAATHPGSDLANLYVGRPSLEGMLREAAHIVYRRFDSRYDRALWSMPSEYFGSLVIFALYGQRLSRTVRLALSLILMAAFHDNYLVLFLVGALLADLGVVDLAARLPRVERGVAVAVGCGAAFGCCDFTGNTLESRLFLHALGACLLVATVLASPALQALLSTRLSVWLGRISFGVYLLHQPILASAGVVLYDRVARVAEPPWHRLAAFVPYTGLVIIAGELFTRLVDLPAIRLSHRIGKGVDRLVPLRLRQARG